HSLSMSANPSASEFTAASRCAALPAPWWASQSAGVGSSTLGSASADARGDRSNEHRDPNFAFRRAPYVRSLSVGPLDRAVRGRRLACLRRRVDCPAGRTRLPQYLLLHPLDPESRWRVGVATPPSGCRRHVGDSRRYLALRGDAP